MSTDGTHRYELVIKRGGVVAGATVTVVSADGIQKGESGRFRAPDLASTALTQPVLDDIIPRVNWLRL